MISRWVIDDWFLGSSTSFIQAQVTFVSVISAFEMGRTYKELFDKIVDRLIDHAYLNQDVFGPEPEETDTEKLCRLGRAALQCVIDHKFEEGEDHRFSDLAECISRIETADIEEVIDTDGNIEEWIDDGGRSYSQDHRTNCKTVGEVGHWNCGWCDTHKCPRHECMCSVYIVQGHKIEIVMTDGIDIIKRSIQ